MAKAIAVETFRGSRATREAARRGDLVPAWRSAWVVRFWNEETQEAVLGGGSSQRVAAMRAAEAAVQKGWF